MKNSIEIVPVDVAASIGMSREKFVKLYAGEKINAARRVYYEQYIKKLNKK